MLIYLEDKKELVMNEFLQFLDTDIQHNPQNVQPFDMSRGRELVEGMDVNIDDKLDDDE
ncbi:MAG TPA: type II toxin-antitoxin system PrlF family antitoxin [Enterobacteriaceae bacterium]|nr:type II toxin-antitoxin system PrlF family antitoxin [Enterobacteriaceae bacterium]